MKDRTVIHPTRAPRLSARHWVRKGDMVRQDPYRMNSSLMGALVWTLITSAPTWARDDKYRLITLGEPVPSN